jgi:hypothetical protein
MSFIKTFSLFYLSLTPLWLSIVFIDVKSLVENTSNLFTEIISIICIGVAMLTSTVVVILAFRKKNISKTQCYTLTEVKEEKIMTAEYVLSYVLPLLAFDFTVWYDVVLFLLFFLVLAFLHIRHNRLGANVMLEVFGYKYYECTLTNEDNIQILKNVISRNNLITKKNKPIYAKSINNEYYLERKK